MIIDASLVIGLIATHIIAAVAPMVIREQYRMAKNGLQLKKLAAQQAALAELRKPSNPLQAGLVTEDIESVVMTEDEHFDHLKRLYPNAWKEYSERNSKPIFSRGDRYIMRLILAYERGDLTATVDEYNINFSNGDKVWIANKYHGYGRLYKSDHNPHCVFDNNFIVSPYTFMRIVDIEEKIAEPILHLTPIKVLNNVGI
ncbi:putative membrane protein [Erwinia phage pEa_SNUABM_50]|uniref:Uncharacterized protein n=4 Tax=Eneladusvirus BF TaxID=2560751 RepID=A0A1S6UAE0_9CAUD|nr:hypothetical protein FDH34_gp173 [Serratia phage BF]QOI71110.1 putative membrane protein [Erwinia phage pEa_SNUABM_12]QOI71655.1 putative membrane protein [Erwinia phage pEa_SNUABM_47]QOI72194.1 putative membrane protein [Erwinia phage pEa_SNUABM_50]QXO11320.1 hypothetical protein pEaSNUABM19_00174 [Erwinia phage pEa_SNUABM_19]QXO11868.1 hypothetical protein pEaSNUABM44_00172 [Erwinia phage pEa_SNUABM_44]QXO12420.1 hypothetical protein pEaSNUABM49_00174 [Erwinia phage pEa_SNUABM_49]